MLFWKRGTKVQPKPDLPLMLYNTLGRELQKFEPKREVVKMYNCGPTVYDVQHIGNLSAMVFADTIRRTLQYKGWSVKQVINITDVGHLQSDADDGDDKMTQGLKREGKALSLENMRELGERFTNIFLDDLRRLNIRTDTIEFPRASAYVPSQIAMISALIEKGYAYTTSDGVYFDTERFPDYGVLGNIDVEEQKKAARTHSNTEKRNSADFALWKFDSGVGWASPWGKGFPGWHIECSAMSRALLGDQLDIHTGGIEHVAIHHNNEIAQSEAATGKRPFSRFWMHRAHIMIEGKKIAKSEGNTIYLSQIVERGFHPLSLRYLFLGAHYRTPMNFTWEALGAAQSAFLKLRRTRDELAALTPEQVPEEYCARFKTRLYDDLDTAGALGILWDALKDSSLSDGAKYAFLLDADRVFGLGLDSPDPVAENLYCALWGLKVKTDDVPTDVQQLIADRHIARESRDWTLADQIREQISNRGYRIEDRATGVEIFKKG